MNEWYKHLHTESRDCRKGPKTVLQSQTWKDMRKSIEGVMTEDLGFADILKKGVYEENEVTLFLMTMMMLLSTHRHLKDDVYIVEAVDKVEKIRNADQPLQGLGPFLNGNDEECADLSAYLQEECNDDKDYKGHAGAFLRLKWEVQRDVSYKYSKKAEDRFMSYFFETYFFAVFGLSAKGRDFILNKDDMTDEKRPKVDAEMEVLTVKAVAQLHQMVTEGVSGLSENLLKRLMRDIPAAI